MRRVCTHRGLDVFVSLLARVCIYSVHKCRWLYYSAFCFQETFLDMYFSWSWLWQGQLCMGLCDAAEERREQAISSKINCNLLLLNWPKVHPVHTLAYDRLLIIWPNGLFLVKPQFPLGLCPSQSCVLTSSAVSLNERYVRAEEFLWELCPDKR